MQVKDVRRARLADLIAQVREPAPNKVFAARVRKKPAQISQWLSGYRSISEQSAREIEARMSLPFGWLDADGTGRATEPTAAYELSASTPTLESALQTVLNAVITLTPMRWAAVRAQLDELVAHPELLDDALDELQHLLRAAPTKGVGAG